MAEILSMLRGIQALLMSMTINICLISILLISLYHFLHERNKK